MQKKQSQLRNQLNQDCVPFKEKSYVKYMVQCKNEDNGRGEIERFKIFTGKQILSEKLHWRSNDAQGIHKEWLIINTQKNKELEI
jgi:hypothetical protein